MARTLAETSYVTTERNKKLKKLRARPGLFDEPEVFKLFNMTIARLLFFQRVCNTTCFLFWLVWYLQTVIYQWALSWNTLLYETKIMHLNPAVIRSSIGQSLRDFHNGRLSLYLFPEWERYNQMYTLFFLLTEWNSFWQRYMVISICLIVS